MNRFLLPLFFAPLLHAGDDRMVEGLNRFGVACYQQLARGDGNLIFSPFSISTALSMVINGARGRTASEISSVLGQVSPDASQARAFSSLTGQLREAGNLGANQLLDANALWAQRGISLEPDFQRTMESFFGAKATQLDFARNPESTRAAINSWTEQHTRGKIHDLFGPGSLSTETRIVLSSAIYFNGKWARPFEEKETSRAVFKAAKGGEVQTNFMNQTGRFGYAETPSLQVLEMKYAGTGFAMDLFLPKPGRTLAEVEGQLASLATWLSMLEDRSVEVAIPNFRAESGFSLRETLSRMGMPDAFRGSADFSGIDGHRNLALSDVLHKAFVDVSEKGTEAAAATGTAAVLVRMVVPQHTVFRADHPFLFVIRDTRTGLILFAGRLAQPTA